MVAGIPFSNDFDLHINRLRKVLHEFLRSEETFQKLDSTVVVLDVILPINSPLLQGSDEFDFKNFQTKRLYTSKTPNVKEDIIDIIDANKGTVLVTQQSKNQHPNYCVRNIKNNKAEAPAFHLV